MPTTPLTENLQALLAKPNPAVIATVRPDGQPVTVATWYLYDGGRILVNMDEGRERLEYLRANPKVSLTVLSSESWYTHVSVRGEVVEIRDDDDFADIDRLCTFYMGSPYSDHSRKRVSAWIEISEWHAWQNGQPFS